MLLSFDLSVAVIRRRTHDRHQPETSNAQIGGRGRIAVIEIVEPVDDAPQVAFAIAIAVFGTLAFAILSWNNRSGTACFFAFWRLYRISFSIFRSFVSVFFKIYS